MKSLQRKKKKEKEPPSRGDEPKSRKGEGEQGVSALRGKDSIVILARKGDLFKEHDDATPMLLLAHVLNVNPSTSPIPSSIANVLLEFYDVFPSELPQGLSPLQGIEHQIDFVLGLQLTNNPAYRSSLLDMKEL